jgi:hypothetical protein
MAKVILKITTRKGSRIESIPLKKIKRMASGRQRFWSVEGDFLVLQAS